MEVQTLSINAAFSKVPGLDSLVSAMKTSWASIKSTIGNNRAKITEFLLNALDSLIVYLVNFDIPGNDKKAIVLTVMNDLYDYIVASALPFWLRPFGRLVKDFVISVLVAHAIDWIVSKYKNGEWNKEPEKVLGLWGVPGGHRPN